MSHHNADSDNPDNKLVTISHLIRTSRTEPDLIALYWQAIHAIRCIEPISARTDAINAFYADMAAWRYDDVRQADICRAYIVGKGTIHRE